jgi:hypothetical protein
MSELKSNWHSRRKQLAWLVLLWTAGVAVVALAAELLRLVMSAVGMTSH